MMQQIPPPPPGFELIGGGSPPPARPQAQAAGQPARQSSPVRSARRYEGPLPTDPRAVFPALVEQESGGRAGVLGPQTPYGRAEGRTQMLPATAQEMARKVGVPWQPELMRGDTTEAAAYQDRLGLAYLEQGLAETGNMRDALRYYHGGPNRDLWGPKTNAYAEEVLSRVRAAPSGPSTPRPRSPTPPAGFQLVGDAELTALADGQGVSVQAGAGMPPEWFIANGLPLDATTEDMLARGFVPDPDKPGFWKRGDPRSEGHVRAIEQERAQLAATDAPSYAEPTFTDQVTAPANDELAWLAGLTTQGIANLGRTLTGQENEIGALDRARAMRDLSREGQERFEQERPLQALGGGVLGGFAFAPARAAALPGLAGRLGQAGAVSSAYGAAEGDGLLGRLKSAGVAGAVGVGTAGVLEGGAPVARGLLGSAERMRAPRGSLPNASERRVTGALTRALERDNTSPQDVLSSLGTMPEGRLPFEAGGENLVGLAETMAQAPGQARASLLQAVGERRDNASNRVAGRLSDSFGAQGNGFQALRQRIGARSEAAKEGMEAIAARPVPLDDASVQAFRSRLTSPAIRNAAEEAIADLSPEGAAAANRLLGLGEQVLDNPGAAQITVREAQDISYALNEAASRAYRGGFNSRGEALSTLAKAVRKNARDTVPEYDAWLTNFGDASEGIDAMRTGQNVFAKANERNAMSAAELRDRWGSWSAQARENYRLGVGEAVLDKVRGNGGVSAMRRLLRDNELADRVRIAFDSEDAFLRFMQTADDEVSMANVDNQILGGSPTARRVASAADVNAQGMGPADAFEMVTDLGSPVAIGRRALGLIAKNLPRRDRSILGNEELNGLIGRALTDEAEMTRLLNLAQTDRGIGERVARQFRGLGLLSAPGVPAAGQQRARGLLTANP